MKTLVYVSGITGIILVFSGIITALYENESLSFLWITGLVMIMVLTLPLLWYSRRKDQQKIDQIIKSYKDHPEATSKIKDEKSPAKGWGMNNSPFRDRKSGLSWGGGNIHAANASRGSRRGFRK